MFDFFVGIALVSISILPTTPKLENWESSLRNSVDTKSESIEMKEIDVIPEEVEDFKIASIESNAAYFVDTKSGRVLAEKNSEQRLPPASITKLMTAILVVSESDLNEIVTITPQNTFSNDASMGLIPGDKLTVSELLHGLLISSGSDAALNLANHIAGSEQEFVALMNERASLLGFSDSQFTNPVGWDQNGNYSTAKDLTNIAKLALSNNDIAEIVSKKSYIAKSELGRSYILSNTNYLLNGTTYKGIKTGTTFRAGQCLATYYDDGTRNIVGVVLSSPYRFTETNNILNWIRNNYIY